MEGGIRKDDKLGIDHLLIIGKYFNNRNDYINVIKLCKKYNELIECYYYNPISDYELFENMQTQRIYKFDDFSNIKEGMYEYQIENSSFNDGIHKDVEHLITQTGRKWIFYVSLPIVPFKIEDGNKNKVFCNDTLFGRIRYTNHNYDFDQIKIHEIICEDFFAESESILDDNEALINTLKKALHDGEECIEDTKLFNYFSEMDKDITEELEFYMGKQVFKELYSDRTKPENEYKRDYFKLTLNFDTGYKSDIAKDVLDKNEHYYAIVNDNFILRDQTFPRFLLSRRENLNLDDYYIAYDTLNNPMGIVDKYICHIDTLEAKDFLTPNDCLVYLEYNENSSLFFPYTVQRNNYYIISDVKNVLCRVIMGNNAIVEYDSGLKKYILKSIFGTVIDRIIILKKRKITEN